jgi:hypothetical protein
MTKQSLVLRMTYRLLCCARDDIGSLVSDKYKLYNASKKKEGETMQQTINCPGCGSPLAPNQKFCGVCGLNLAGVMQQKANTCPTCNSPIAPGQQFCGVCGAKMPMPGQQPVAQAGTASPVAKAPAAKPSTSRPRSYGILSIAGVIFQIFGWIVLVFGILASIGIAIWAGIGGAFQFVLPGMETISGVTAIIMAIGGIIASLIYGFGLLAFAEICYAAINVQKDLE